MTLLSVFLASFTLIASAKLSGRAGKYFGQQQKNIGALNGYIEEMMEGQKVVKVFCHEEQSIKDFRQLNENLRDSANRANAFTNIIGPVNNNLGHLSYVVCAVVGGLLAIHQVASMTLGGLVTFLTLNRNFSRPISQVSQQMNSIVMAMAGARRIFAMMDEAPETDEGYVLYESMVMPNGLIEFTYGVPGGPYKNSAEALVDWGEAHGHPSDFREGLTYKQLQKIFGKLDKNSKSMTLKELVIYRL
jgi:ATP-binding cassette subfamily B protein